MNYEEKLNIFIAAQGLAAEHLVFEASCHSVAEAAVAAGITERDLVKSICMIGRTGRLIVAIVKGEDRADRRRVGDLLGEKAPRLAKSEEILERTGYPCGGTPPFGFEATFIVDERVMEMPLVYAGGGTATSLVRVAPAEIVRLGGIVGAVRVREV
ncbi:aminoacyl-tRNA deacylase [Geobacter sp. DSM 9736]|uniref:aminoacyl-tRNA deacylase n=1 Tax=Geobacter sp. DSM 9736 TaxID=1277350 RepID=UPI000B5022B5|nr:YbaK/EbsC family protein [Geobacter sp. DSM 9736]SNB45318.1 Cys-tRNA(Pro) deacylase, prolyl-tRNA editing enzyme YbaK/EbsC [Geobacter sp. DSM 9736]